MAPARKQRLGWWLGFAFGFFVMSVAAIAVRALSYPGYVPRPIVHVLEPFVEPGVAIWWLTIGKVFQAFPSEWAGRAVAALSNTAFWLLVCAIGAALWRGGLRAVRRLRG